MSPDRANDAGPAPEPGSRSATGARADGDTDDVSGNQAEDQAEDQAGGTAGDTAGSTAGDTPGHESGSTAAPGPDEEPVVMAPPPTTVRGIVWQLVASTVGACMRYRVTGLAAEAAFFAVLSLPPLVFGLVGSIGYFANRYDVAEVAEFEAQIIDFSSRALTEDTVDQIIRPTLSQVLTDGRFDVISIGFVLALWSGSRALNVFVDTITIMYGLGGRRGIVRTRALSFSLYLIALFLGIIVVPLVLAGPALVSQLIPDQIAWLQKLYWPTVLVLTVAFITTLYHLSVPVRTSWRYDIPGAVLTLLVWIGGSWLLRATLSSTLGGSTSIYGPLAAPIVVLLWLFILSIAVLIGAALNAAFDRVFPEKSTARARLELVRRLRDRAMAARMREVGLDEHGLTALTSAVAPTEPEARRHLDEHHQRITLDEEARREGRQREGRRRLRAADEPPSPPPVAPDDETELLQRPPQTR